MSHAVVFYALPPFPYLLMCESELEVWVWVFWSDIPAKTGTTSQLLYTVRKQRGYIDRVPQQLGNILNEV